MNEQALSVLNYTWKSTSEESQLINYLAISPVHHLAQGQIGPIDARGLPPYWQAKKDDDKPKG